MAPREFDPTWAEVSAARAAIPQMPGIMNRQTKKKEVPL